MVFPKIFHKIQIYLKWWFKLWHPFSKNAYLLAVPTHDNIGDEAIVIAEEEFLRKCGFTRVIQITMTECWDYYQCILRLLAILSDKIFFHGGGNLGDIYDDENLRRVMLSIWNKECVVFPQTLFYSDNVEGLKKKKSSIIYYNKNTVTIAAREVCSEKMLQELYPRAGVILAPDIVLSMGRQHFDERRKGILFCFRDDQEKRVSDAEVDSMIAKLKENYPVRKTSMIYSEPVINKEMRNSVVFEKMREVASSKVMVTDRLHGMIFAALTETPCVVFGNNHHKVQGVYDWIKHLNYIRYVLTIEEALKEVEELYHISDCKFQMDENTFCELKNVICR